MSKPFSRTRRHYALSSKTPVSIGDHHCTVADYSDWLDRRASALEEVATRVPDISRDALTKAINCGRMLTSKSGAPLERCWYCRKSRLCPVCNLLRAKARAEEFLNDLKLHGGKMVLYDLLFTFSPPQSDAEEDRQVKVAVAACKHLLTHRSRYNKLHEHKDENKSMLRINLSIHLRPTSPGGLATPHIHGTLVTTPAVLLRDVSKPLTDWWQFLTDVEMGRRSHAFVKPLGRLGNQAPAIKNPRRHIGFRHLHNKLAYNMRWFKVDELPVDTAHRIELLNRLGIKTTCSQSRKLTDTPRVYPPHEYDPVELHHNRLCVCLPDWHPIARESVHQYRELQSDLTGQADQWLTRQSLSGTCHGD